ncbi:MAG: alpha/beta hydrolase [Steroidobacteraceae bacterium]
MHATEPAYGVELEGFAYPFKVERFTFMSQRRQVSMEFMDVAATKPNGRTEVLLHGKNPYAVGADAAALKMPGATRVKFEDLGHSPHVEAPQRFMPALLAELAC